MVKSCAAYGCNTYAEKGISFYSFPKDPELRRKWVIAVNRGGWTPSNYSILCGYHFRPEDVVYNFGKKSLRPGVIPTLEHCTQKKPQSKITKRPVKSNVVQESRGKQVRSESNTRVESNVNDVETKQNTIQVSHEEDVRSIRNTVKNSRVGTIGTRVTTVQELHKNKVSNNIPELCQEEVEAKRNTIQELHGDEVLNNVLKLYGEEAKTKQNTVQELDDENLETILLINDTQESHDEEELGKVQNTLKHSNEEGVKTVISIESDGENEETMFNTAEELHISEIKSRPSQEQITNVSTSTMMAVKKEELTKLKRSKKRKIPCYMGDVTEEDLYNPRKIKKIWKIATMTVEKQRKTIKYLRTKMYCLKKRVQSLTDQVNNLKASNKYYLNHRSNHRKSSK